ncbi:hypothetical protein K501DRAFT_297120 [Backusella circina FSU 941]|nr:hypothetical protein K501DRAFT_297120 [Backusella circina FSU 941]
MELIENDDPDWYLVKLNGIIGLVPSNYIQSGTQEEAGIQVQEPDHMPAPPLPAVTPQATQSTTARELIQDDAQSWTVHEYDQAKKKKKKDKGNLFVGNGMICYGSETDKSLPVQQYPILDVTKYLLDSKNLHIEIEGAKSAVLNLQAASKSEAKAILAKITESTRAAQSASTHINNATPASPPVQISPQPPVLPPMQNRQIPPPQPQRATQPPVIEYQQEDEVEEEEEEEEGANCIPKWGISIYNFQAEGGDELSVEENEQLYVLNYERTDGWWRVQKVDGLVGLVPSAYVQFDDEEEESRPAPVHETHADVDEIRRKREEEERELQQRRIAEERAREQQRDQRERDLQSIREQEGRERQQIREKEENEKRRRDQEENDRRIAEEIDRREREEVKKNEIQRKREEEERRRQVQEAAKRAEMARQRQIEEDYKRKEMERKASLSRQKSQNNHQDLPKPDTSKVRTWTDRSGTFRVEAQYIDFHNGKLRLHKLNGVKIDVPVEKMCEEDIQWVEEHQRNMSKSPLQIQQEEEESTPIMPPRPKAEPQAPPPPQQPPQKKLNASWDWFDWFMVIGIPMQASLQYSSAFKAEKMDDSDIGKLTHKQMKTLGLKEEHVRRVERYIETGVPEDASDDDEEKTKQKQAQIEKDEELARKLQTDWESEQSKTNTRSVPAGRPRPNVSAPKDIHPDLLDFLGSSSDTSKEPEKAKSDLIGFQDDAWAPRSGNSPAIAASSGLSMQPMVPTQTGPSPEELAAAQKASETERLRLNEEEQIQKIQIMSLKKQAQEQQKQLEQLQQLTRQQLEVQKQLAMQTGTQQQQQQMQRMQQMQYEQQQIQQQLEPTLPQNSQLQQQILQQQQQLHQQLQQLPQNNQQQQLLQQQQQLQQQFQNPAGRPRPTANQGMAIDPSLGQWQSQPQQQQIHATGFQPGAMVLSGQQQQPLQTGYQQPTGLGIQNTQWQSQQLQSQMTGITPGYHGQANYQQPMATSNVPLSSVLPQPLTPSAAGQQHMNNGFPQGVNAQVTGRHWNNATPDNPFGSPAMSSLSPQMTGGVQFSTPSPQSFNPSVLQAQMTGQPTRSIFTPQGSMQYGQSAFPNEQRRW